MKLAPPTTKPVTARPKPQATAKARTLRRREKPGAPPEAETERDREPAATPARDTGTAAAAPPPLPPPDPAAVRAGAEMRQRLTASHQPSPARAAPAFEIARLPITPSAAAPAVPLAGAALEREAEQAAEAVADGLPAQVAAPAGAATPPPPPGAPGDEGGRPLPPAAAARLEASFGHSFADVRIHDDAAADAHARAIGAAAFTVGGHLYFRQGRFDPESRAGLRLAAHELTHVLQQRRGGQALLARQLDATPKGPFEEQEIRPGLVIQRGQGWAVVRLRDQPWAVLQWNAAETRLPVIEVGVTQGDAGVGLGLRVLADFEIVAQLDRTLEDVRSETDYTLFSYDLRFPGTIQVDEKKSVAPPYRVRELYAPPRRHMIEDRPVPLTPPTPPTPDILDPLKDAPEPRSAPDQRQRQEQERARQELIRGHPAFKSRAEMEAFISAHPDQAYIGIVTTEGQFVARRLDERELQRVADALRVDEHALPEVAWDARTRRSGWDATGVYAGGRKIDNRRLRDLFFSDDFIALASQQGQRGRDGELGEAELFHMGGRSFGRKALTHDEALDRWRALDALDARAVARLETEPGHRFFSLWVHGPGGFHEIGDRYFRGREIFRKHLDLLNQDVGNLQELIAGDRDVAVYLRAELDRQSEDPTFRASLLRRPELADAVGRFAFDEVEDLAQQIAVDRVLAGRDALAPLAEDPDRLRAWVLGFASMGRDQQDQSMRFVGVPLEQQPYLREVLSDPRRATNVAFGIDESRTRHVGVGRGQATVRDLASLEQLQTWVQETVKGYDDALDQLRSRKVSALKLEGDLGNHVRKLTYDRLGFRTLDPAKYPPREEGPDYLPDPLTPGRFHYTTIGEQLFANRAARVATQDFALDVLKVTGKVLLSIALMVVAQELGAAAAGLLFAEGTAAFVATELVVSGVAFTALNDVGSLALEGRTASGSLAGFAEQSLINVATFGAFRALNVLLAAGARSFVAGRVGEAAFRASRGAQVAAEALRITGVGATFLVAGLAQRLATNQLPRNQREWFLFAYENLLTLALLEGSAPLTRVMMERTGIWARSARLGSLQKPVDELRGDVVRLQRDVSSLAVRPQAAGADAPALVAKQKALLVRQRALAEQLRQSFRTRGDAAALEAEAGRQIQLIDEALAGLAQADFLTAEHVLPVEGSESVFTYRPGPDALPRFQSVYGAERVHAEPDGTIGVEVPGLVTRELLFTPEGTVTAGTATVTRQEALAKRQQALLERAANLGVTDPTLDAIRSLRPRRQTRPEMLDQTEEAIATAEAKAGQAMDKVTGRVLTNLKRRLGARAVDQIRTGELAGVTDKELADVLWQARGFRAMGIPQLRALVLAARPAGPGERAIDLTQLRKTMLAGSANITVEVRNFALETWAKIAEARVPGARALLADMSKTPSDFWGGLFVAEYIRFHVGIENVARIEEAVKRPFGERKYDIQRRDGTRDELKNWQVWEGERVTHLFEQFDFDMRELTDHFKNPLGLDNVRYIFRSPPPRSVFEIRAELRARLENLLKRDGATPDQRQDMLQAFDTAVQLVQSPTLQFTGGLPAAPPPARPVVPALPSSGRDHDDDLSDVPSPP